MMSASQQKVYNHDEQFKRILMACNREAGVGVTVHA
jgi:hypothetical protein